MPINTFSSGNVVTSEGHNSNWALAVLTDTARTITVSHTWSAGQYFAGSINTFGASAAQNVWLSTYKVIELGTVAAFTQVSTDNHIYHNAFVNASGTEKYITTAQASKISMGTTGIVVWAAASGTAGNTVTFTDVLDISHLGVTSNVPFSVNAGTQTSDINLVSVAGTWNSAGTTFTGIELNITSTASAAGSLLMDLQLGGASQFSVSKAGVAAVASGVKFPATQSASSDANTLDDYEEGTWTPSLGGNATYTQQNGRYVKVGKRVDVWCDLIVNVLGTGSTTTISGLPVTVANAVVSQAPGAVSYFSDLATNVIFLSCYAVGGATTIGFNNIAAAGVAATNLPAIFGNSARVTLTITYEAA